ncbi:MAG: outer membrane lipoprotein-sorting protein, partial [Desulfobacterota bacterium]|nr:outer membrane lipoprotein-sorting protein [Thermodesulfobacteriota bacterium]
MKAPFTFFTAFLVFSAIHADAAEKDSVPPVDEIVTRANLTAYYQGFDGKSRVAMTITDKQGRTRTRDFIILRKTIEQGGDQKYFVYFQNPADVRKMV